MPDSMPKDMPDRTRGSDYVSLCQNIFENIHPASRGVAAHTAGLFRSVRGAKGGFPPWGLPKLRIFTFPPVGAPQAREFSLFPPVGAPQAREFSLFPPVGAFKSLFGRHFSCASLWFGQQSTKHTFEAQTTWRSSGPKASEDSPEQVAKLTFSGQVEDFQSQQTVPPHG